MEVVLWLQAVTVFYKLDQFFFKWDESSHSKNYRRKVHSIVQSRAEHDTMNFLVAHDLWHLTQEYINSMILMTLLPLTLSAMVREHETNDFIAVLRHDTDTFTRRSTIKVALWQQSVAVVD